MTPKHGKPEDRLVPKRGVDRDRVAAAIAHLKDLSRGCRLDGLSVRELRDEGRS